VKKGGCFGFQNPFSIQQGVNMKKLIILDRITRELLHRLAATTKKIDPYPLVQNKINAGFQRISEDQFNLLCFYVLAELSRILGDPAELKKKLDSMNEMSEETSLRLQMLMDRRSRFMSTLSNIMKKISTTQDDLVQNIK
jgi:hypothetical protein